MHGNDDSASGAVADPDMPQFGSPDDLHNELTMENSIRNKEEDLRRKLDVKASLKKIFKVAQDKRFDDIDAYFKILTEQYKDFFNNDLSGATNLETVLNAHWNENDGSLALQEINNLVHLHNNACFDEVYGQRLFKYAKDLVEAGKVKENFPEQIYILSVDWPLDLLMEKFSVPRDSDSKVKEAEY